MAKFIKKGLQHEGFGVIEIMSQCPTHFGRYAKGTGNPAFLMKWIEENTISAKKASEASEEEKEGKFVTGEFVDIERPVFRGSSVYEKENCR
jgi:2-oxoglutarate ferredoxin oxidoreductase subunit beta